MSDNTPGIINRARKLLPVLASALALSLLTAAAMPLSGCCCRRTSAGGAPGAAVTTPSGRSYTMLIKGDIFIDGQHGLMLKYLATTIDEPTNQREARDIFELYRPEAEKRGLNLVSISAIVPEKRTGPFYQNRHNNMGFERAADGHWYRIGRGGKRSSTPIEAEPVASEAASGAGEPGGEMDSGVKD